MPCITKSSFKFWMTVASHALLLLPCWWKTLICALCLLSTYMQRFLFQFSVIQACSLVNAVPQHLASLGRVYGCKIKRKYTSDYFQLKEVMLYAPISMTILITENKDLTQNTIANNRRISDTALCMLIYSIF